MEVQVLFRPPDYNLMSRHEFPIDKDLLAKDIRTVIEKIDTRTASRPVEIDRLSEETRELYLDFVRLVDLVEKELNPLDCEGDYSPHFAAWAVANVMGLPAYIVRDGTHLRIKINSLVRDYSIETDD